MSQKQPRKPGEDQEQPPDPIKYGEVFSVSGELASKPVAPQDAAMMRSAETTAFGSTQPGGPAEVARAAATMNMQAGVVAPGDASADQGVIITGVEVPGGRIITESIGGQVVAQHVQVTSGVTEQQQTEAEAEVPQQSAAVTIGQALEATIQTVGDKPVDPSDAAAIREAEMRATGTSLIVPGGYASTAQSAAAYNTGMVRDEDKIKFRDVVVGAGATLPAKAVTRQDAEAVAHVERMNNPQSSTLPGGVADSMDTAAKLNENVNKYM